MPKHKYQIILQNGREDMSDEQMLEFQGKVGEENVIYQAIPACIDVIERLPIFIIHTDGTEETYCGEDALAKMTEI